MLPPDVWDRRGRSEAAWTKVAWKGRTTWRTDRPGLQVTVGAWLAPPCPSTGVGKMTPGPLHNQQRHPWTAPGCPTTPCPAQWTWPTTRPWGSSSRRTQGTVGRDPTTTRSALAPHWTQQRYGDRRWLRTLLRNGARLHQSLRVGKKDANL